MAGRAMGGERRDHTLQPTALVNEAYLRLAGKPASWESHAEFLRTLGRVMREILVDHARRRGAAKRGGEKLELLDCMAMAEYDPATMLAVDAALNKLEEVDPRGRQIVELRYFAGLTVEETAQVMNLSAKTITRDWNFVRVWLERELLG